MSFSLPAWFMVLSGTLADVRISRFFAGGLVSAAVVVTLSGCVGAPPLTVYGGLAERCFETTTTDDGYFAHIGIKVENESSRSVILREVGVLDVENATVGEIVIVPVPSVYTIFGDAPGGLLTPEQRALYRDREAVDGTVVDAGDSVDVVVELRADDYTEYAGLRGLRLKYDDGWFSATSTSEAVVGFVPPWAQCGSRER